MSANLPLYHLTCEHGRNGIGTRGMCVPNPEPRALEVQPWLTQMVSWFTTDPEADQYANGLASLVLPCNRTKYVYRVITPGRCEPWIGSKHRTQFAIDSLEGPGQRPELWWVATEPVAVRLVRVRGGV